MQEREHYHLAIITAETMYNLWELKNQQRELDLDESRRRLKDLSAYSLTHAEIMVQREGVAFSPGFVLWDNKREPLPEKPGAALSFV